VCGVYTLMHVCLLCAVCVWHDACFCDYAVFMCIDTCVYTFVVCACVLCLCVYTCVYVCSTGVHVFLHMHTCGYERACVGPVFSAWCVHMLLCTLMLVCMHVCVLWCYIHFILDVICLWVHVCILWCVHMCVTNGVGAMVFGGMCDIMVYVYMCDDVCLFDDCVFVW
jgi:hypothetical protein